MKSSHNKFIVAIILVAAFFVAIKVFAADFPTAPSPAKLVNDYANILSSSEEQGLEKTLRDYADQTSDQIAIVTVTSIGDYDISDYAQRLARSWGIGQKGVDNGILILVAKNEKGIDIETGHRIGVSVTDNMAYHIILDQMIPAFNKGSYATGLRSAVSTMIDDIKKNPYN